MNDEKTFISVHRRLSLLFHAGIDVILGVGHFLLWQF